MSDDANLVPGRNCDGCGLCCMILRIEELEKPHGTWCTHCSTRRHCDIYEERPTECATFHCGYLTNANIDDRWKPSKSKLILVSELDGNRIAAHVHPKHPNAWKAEPFYSTLKQLAVNAVPLRHQIIVCVGKQTFMIFPDRDVDLGIVTEDHLITITESKTAAGIYLQASVMHKDDPRAQNIAK